MSKPLLPDWFRFHLGAYARKTAHLTTLQHGAYFLLIQHYYGAGALPTDDRALATICKMSMHQWNANRATLAAFFDENWKHDKCEEELAVFRRTSEARAKAGAAGARGKAQNATRGRDEAPQIFDAPFAKKSNEAFEAIPLINKDPVPANAGDLRDRVFLEEKRDDKESSSSSATTPASEPPRVDDDDSLIIKVQEALGPETEAHVAIVGLPTVKRWLVDGCSLELDVLPELKLIGRKAKGGLGKLDAKWVTERVVAKRRARLMAPNTLMTETVFVFASDPDYPGYCKASGHKATLTVDGRDKTGKPGVGYYFRLRKPPSRPSGEALH